MSLLQKIKNRKRTEPEKKFPESSEEKKFPESSEEKKFPESISEPLHLAGVDEVALAEDGQGSQGSQRLIPTDCETCAGSEFWIDIHGGGPHCRDCRRPPTSALILAEYFTTEDGKFYEIVERATKPGGDFHWRIILRENLELLLTNPDPLR